MAGKINLTDQLKKYFGFDNFKGNQEPIIQNLLDGNDTFVLMPTGHCYFSVDCPDEESGRCDAQLQ